MRSSKREKTPTRLLSINWLDALATRQDCYISFDLTQIRMKSIDIRYSEWSQFKYALKNTRRLLRHDVICVTWLIHVCDMTHSYEWHDTIIYICDIRSGNTRRLLRRRHTIAFIRICKMTHSCIRLSTDIAQRENTWDVAKQLLAFVFVKWPIRARDIAKDVSHSEDVSHSKHVCHSKDTWDVAKQLLSFVFEEWPFRACDIAKDVWRSEDVWHVT